MHERVFLGVFVTMDAMGLSVIDAPLTVAPQSVDQLGYGLKVDGIYAVALAA